MLKSGGTVQTVQKSTVYTFLIYRLNLIKNMKDVKPFIEELIFPPKLVTITGKYVTVKYLSLLFLSFIFTLLFMSTILSLKDDTLALFS